MRKSLHSVAAIVLLSAGFLGATDAHAQSCLQIGAKAGDPVRLGIQTASAFWFQEMDLTVKAFTEFAELQSMPGGSFCGIVRVQIPGNLVPGGMGQNEIILLTDTSLKPGTRLHLSEFVFVGNNLLACSDVGQSDTCMSGADLFRTATVENR